MNASSELWWHEGVNNTELQNQMVKKMIPHNGSCGHMEWWMVFQLVMSWVFWIDGKKNGNLWQYQLTDIHRWKVCFTQHEKCRTAFKMDDVLLRQIWQIPTHFCKIVGIWILLALGGMNCTRACFLESVDLYPHAGVILMSLSNSSCPSFGNKLHEWQHRIFHCSLWVCNVH